MLRLPSGSVTYSNVKNAHIVPACYLCAWERNGKLTVHLTGEVSEAFELPARSVGTRRRAYRRERPSGMVIDDVERTLGRIEADAASLLGSPTTWWPPTQDEKTQLALFFGYQIVRGPRWMSWHDALREAHPPVTSTTPDSTARLIAMLKIGAHMSSLVGTMHWTLLEFGRPVIATSDQPVVIWPKAANARTPTPTPFELDDLACSEIRLPYLRGTRS